VFERVLAQFYGAETVATLSGALCVHTGTQWVQRVADVIGARMRLQYADAPGRAAKMRLTVGIFFVSWRRTKG
jgi:hypothetical protein